MSNNATPRIVIKDLPPIEQMSDEELAKIFGAGRFQPTFEVLEDRQLMSVSVTGISATPISPNNSPGTLDTTAITVKHAGVGTDYNLKVLIESGSTVIRTLDMPIVNLAGTTAETVTWDGKNAAGAFVADGLYSALAQYNAGALTGKVTTSPSKSMLIDNTAPNAPTNLALSTGGTLTNKNKPTIIGKAEAGSTVKLYDGTTLVGSAISTGTFSITPTTPLSNGIHNLTATATDAAGNTGVSSSALTCTIDTMPPVAPTNLSLSTGGTLTNNSKPTIAGSAEPGSTVTLYEGATVLGSGTTSTGTFSIIITHTLSNGLNKLTAKATDTAGNISALSNTLSITVDASAPNAPTNLSTGGSLTNNNKPTVTGNANAGSTVKIYADGGSNVIGSGVATSAGTFSITLSTVLIDGVHSLTATATLAGHTGAFSTALNITVDTTAPVAPVNLALSTGGNLTNNNKPTITSNAEVGSTVKLYDGNILVGNGIATTPDTFSITPTTSLSDGIHNFTVTATDAAGNTSVSSTALRITIDTNLVQALPDGHGGVVALSTSGLVTYYGAGGSATQVDSEVTRIALASDGSLYEISGGGLYRFPNAAVHQYTGLGGVLQLESDGKGGVVALSTAGVVTYYGAGGSATQVDSGVTRIALASDGSLYEISGGGLYRFPNAAVHQYTGLGGVLQLESDGKGGVLALGSGGVLTRYASGGTTSTVDTQTAAFAVASDGSLYLLDNGGSLTRYNDAQPTGQVIDSNVTNLFVTSDGRIYYRETGHLLGGVHLIPPGGQPSYIDGRSQQLFMTPDGTVYNWEGPGFQLGACTAAAPQGLVIDSNVTNLFVTSDGRIYYRETGHPLGGVHLIPPGGQPSYIDGRSQQLFMTPDGTVYIWEGPGFQLVACTAAAPQGLVIGTNLVQGTDAQGGTQAYIMLSDGSVSLLIGGQFSALSGAGNLALVQGTDGSGRAQAYIMQGDGSVSLLIGGVFSGLTGPGNKALVQGTDALGRAQAYIMQGDGSVSLLNGGQFGPELSGPGNEALVQGTDGSGRAQAYIMQGDGSVSLLIGSVFSGLTGPGNKALVQGTDALGRAQAYIMQGDGSVSLFNAGQFVGLSGAGNLALVQGTDGSGRAQAYIMQGDGSVSLLIGGVFSGLTGPGNKALVQGTDALGRAQAYIMQGDGSVSLLNGGQFGICVGTSGVTASDGSLWFLGTTPNADGHGNYAIYRISNGQSPQVEADGIAIWANNGNAVEFRMAQATLSNATPGASYTATITMPGSSGGFSYSLLTNPGTLPPGLSLDSAGHLSGTPTVGGTFTFTVQVASTTIPGLVGSEVCTLTVNTYTTITTTSPTWSGYAIQPAVGSKVNSVGGSWIEPTYSSSDTGSNSIWVGIDGNIVSNTVEQIGTAWDSKDGYSAWVEFYGDYNNSKGFDSNGNPIDPGPYYGQYNIPITVRAGDTISAEVIWLPDNLTSKTSTFNLELQDIPNPKIGGDPEMYDETLTTSFVVAQRATGEWISEAPGYDGAVQPLANFGTVTFTGAWANVGSNFGPVNAFQNPTAISMLPNGNPRGGTDTTSGLTPSSSAGPWEPSSVQGVSSSSFTVKWLSALGTSTRGSSTSGSNTSGSNTSGLNVPPILVSQPGQIEISTSNGSSGTVIQSETTVGSTLPLLVSQPDQIEMSVSNESSGMPIIPSGTTVLPAAPEAEKSWDEFHVPVEDGEVPRTDRRDKLAVTETEGVRKDGVK